MSTWEERLKLLVGSRYETSMRRSFQSVILYEAKRCVKSRLSSLRPFQRKLAFVDQAQALVESLDMVLDHQKEEILWRTANSKEQLKPDVAWKRVKLIENELTRLCEEVKPFVTKGRSHQESVDLLVRHLFQRSNVDVNMNKPVPTNWEHAHNHVLLAFRLYYSGDQLDEKFPAAIPPKDIVVPAQKPSYNSDPAKSYFLKVKTEGTPKRAPRASRAATSVVPIVPRVAGQTAGAGGTSNLEENDGDERRKILQEVREHLELLKEFEGTISSEDIAKRKRDLFLAMPSAPPALFTGSPNKKPKAD